MSKINNHLIEEDKRLVWGLLKLRDDLRKESVAVAKRMLEIKKELRNLSDLKIAEKFEVANVAIGRQQRMFTQHIKHVAVENKTNEVNQNV